MNTEVESFKLDANIIQDIRNPFLERSELLMEIKSPIAPSLQQIRNELGKDESVAVIKKVHANFGKQRFLAEILVYDSEESKRRIETIPKKIRKKMEEERRARETEEKKKAAEEAKAAAEAAEKPEELSPEVPTDLPEESVETKASIADANAPATPAEVIPSPEVVPAAEPLPEATPTAQTPTVEEVKPEAQDAKGENTE